MKYFYDTEFIEDGRTIELLSLGIVSDDQRTLYLINDQADLSKANDWVKQNVLPQLDNTTGTHQDLYRTSPENIAKILKAFVGSSPELWGYMCAFDHVILSQLFKGFANWPAGWPYFSHDVAQVVSQLGFKTNELPNTNPAVHHALCDALWARDTYRWLRAEALTKTLNGGGVSESARPE